MPLAGAVAAAPDVLDVVLEEIARISACPKADLHQTQTLAGELGFDSLMITELELSLGKRLAPLPVPVDLNSALTIGELVTLVAPEEPGSTPLAGEAVTAVAAAPGRDKAMAAAPAWDEAAVAAPAWDESAARIDGFPEVASFETRLEMLDAPGALNPYFRIHQANLRNTTRIDGRDYVPFSGYNYLGLSGHPTVSQAVHDAVERYGSSVSASRLLAGERQLTRQLETELAGLLGTADALALVSGHATNVTAIGHLVGPGDLVVHDSLAHDSILQGCKLSGATRRPFAHNDLGQLEHILRRARSQFRRVLIAVEGAYSMDGDLVDLPRLVECRAHRSGRERETHLG